MNLPTTLLPPPEEDTPENEPFQSYSRREIIGILENIIERASLVTLYFNQGEEHIVTTLLSINPEFEELVFDSAVRTEQGERILKSRRLTFVTFVDHIKIQFHSQAAQLTTFEGKPALRIRVPDSILRLQRRDAFRVNTPKAGPVYCEINAPEAGVTKFMVSDLSVGGIGVIAGLMPKEFTPGSIFENCKVDLPGYGSFTATLQIRHGSGYAKDGRGNPRQHYGCQFLNLGGPIVNQIQRYINQLERDRRALT